MSAIFLSTGAFKGETPRAMAEACAEMGVGLELSSGVKWSAALADEIDGLISAAICPLLVHNYFPPPEKPFVLNLAARDAATLEASRRHVREALALSARCGADFYSVHSGFALDLRAEDLGRPEAQARMKKVPYAEALRIFRESVRELARCGREHGVRLLIENNVLAKEQAGGERPLLMTEPHETAEFLRDMEDVGLLLDVGHAKVAAGAAGFDAADFFRQTERWIGALHLSDNDGLRDCNGTFDEAAWFAEYLGPDVPVVIEVYGIGAGGAREQVATLRAMMR